VLTNDAYTGHLQDTKFHITVCLQLSGKEQFTSHFYYMV